MNRIRAALSCILLFSAAMPLAAQDLNLYVSADTVTVGERFYVSIAAKHDFAASPSFPEPSDHDSLVFGDVEVIRRQTLNSVSSVGMRIDSVVYEVATFALDTARIAPIPVLFTAGEDTFTVHTESAQVLVESLVPPDAEDVRDLAPLVEFPVSVWMYITAAAGLLLLLAALVAFYLWRRRRHGDAEAPASLVPKTPPDVEAFERLKELEETDLARREAVKLFYVELSDVLRTYIYRRLDVHALESTTRELIGELKQHRVPDEKTRNRLRDVLTLSDYVKFADAEPPPAESRSALLAARSVVESVEEQLRPKLETIEAEEAGNE